MDLGKSSLGISANECLLVDPANALDSADIAGIPSSQIARMMLLYFAMMGKHSWRDLLTSDSLSRALYHITLRSYSADHAFRVAEKTWGTILAGILYKL